MAHHAQCGSDALTHAAAEEEALEAGRRLFAAEVQFVWGAATPEALPEAKLPEVAFAGRSNVGKSSLINALTGRKSLARTSQTPGHTRQLNFFELAQRILLVDMPGYGYAKASKRDAASWQKLVRTYCRGRPTLRRLFLLVDARHGPKEGDREMMRLLEEAAVGFQIALTKADKVQTAELATLLAALDVELAAHPAGHPTVIVTSALDGDGIPELRAAIAAVAAGT
jgi:GTP-binding protein